MYPPAMGSRPWLTIVRAASVVLVLAAITAQAVVLAQNDRFDPGRFFAFFTIQSNIIGVAAYLWLLRVGAGTRSRALELLRGAAAVYLTVTFFVVIFLLSNVDVQLGLVWVDVVLHKIFPVIIVLDWILDPPTTRIGVRAVPIWLVYPLVWTALTMVRGALDDWYPYPFLDPADGGYGRVVITAIAITVGFVVISLAIVALGRLRGRPEDAPAA